MANISIEEAFDIIELKDRSILIKMQNAKSYEEACKAIEELHVIVGKQKRKIAKKYHPDLGGDEEHFKKISNVCDMLMGIKAQRMQPIQHYRTIIIRTSNYATGTASTTSDIWTVF